MTFCLYIYNCTVVKKPASPCAALLRQRQDFKADMKVTKRTRIRQESRLLIAY